MLRRIGEFGNKSGKEFWTYFTSPHPQDMTREVIHPWPPDSVRQGTRAERMENQVPEKLKAERSAMLRELSEKNQITFYSSFIGKTRRVLIEKIDRNGFATGYGEHYIPFRFYAGQFEKNTFHNVRAVRTEGFCEKVRLFGEIVQTKSTIETRYSITIKTPYNRLHPAHKPYPQNQSESEANAPTQRRLQHGAE
ncbi:MAG: threonylcarbamoyladenosine tRNA methylthiotransferase MtaB [Anaerophaga sp.]|nr:threonylcarbamoyladenosine tRNA methylthiotransferase MtaB [Anaerophaga sp.]MDK2841555.1 threonylcarbamoyladenosine tRNA methylthiotransferase MtaB [Anaerophaga sp.]